MVWPVPLRVHLHRIFCSVFLNILNLSDWGFWYFWFNCRICQPTYSNFLSFDSDSVGMESYFLRTQSTLSETSHWLSQSGVRFMSRVNANWWNLNNTSKLQKIALTLLTGSLTSLWTPSMWSGVSSIIVRVHTCSRSGSEGSIPFWVPQIRIRYMIYFGSGSGPFFLYHYYQLLLLPIKIKLFFLCLITLYQRKSH
jgi:hypothetical protein